MVPSSASPASGKAPAIEAISGKRKNDSAPIAASGTKMPLLVTWAKNGGPSPGAGFELDRSSASTISSGTASRPGPADVGAPLKEDLDELAPEAAHGA